MSRQPHASAALLPGKETPVPIAEEAVWAPESGPAIRGNFGGLELNTKQISYRNII